MQPPAMRAFAFLPKNDGITDNDFAAHWPKARPGRSDALANASLIVFSKVVQNPIVGAPVSAYSAVAEVSTTLANLAAVQIALATDHSVYGDAAAYINFKEIVVVGGQEHIVMMGPHRLATDTILRGLWVTPRKPGMSVKEYHDYWLHKHGPLVPRTPSLVRYVQYHTHSRPDARSGLAAFDGVSDLAWHDITGFNESWISSQMREEQHPDLPHFLDMNRLSGAFVRETWKSRA